MRERGRAIMPASSKKTYQMIISPEI